jgi:MFS family permease
VTAGRRGLIGLLCSEAVSLTGTRLSMIALPWFVLTSTGSATSTGLVAACEAAPYVVSKTLGGPLVDRVGPRRISVLADTASTLTVAAVPVLHALGALPFGVLLLLVGLTGAVRGPGDNAKRALVPDVSGDAGVPLERATGLSGTIDRLADTAGPALAGVVVAGLGPLTALAMDAASFAIAAVVISLTAPRRWQPDPNEDRYLTRLRAGIAFVHREPLLRLIVAVVAVTNLVDAALISVLLPVWAKDTNGGPLAIGALSAVVGVTQMLGSITAATLGHRLPRRATFLIGFVVAGAPRFAILALSAPLWLAVTVWAVSGCSGGFLNPILQATMFERIPRVMLGRATAVASSLGSAGTPLAGPLAAGLLTLTGLTPALLLSAGVYLAATTLPAFRPEWRDMDTHHPQQQGAGSTIHPGGGTGTNKLIPPEPTSDSR